MCLPPKLRQSCPKDKSYIGTEAHIWSVAICGPHLEAGSRSCTVDAPTPFRWDVCTKRSGKTLDQEYALGAVGSQSRDPRKSEGVSSRGNKVLGAGRAKLGRSLANMQNASLRPRWGPQEARGTQLLGGPFPSRLTDELEGPTGKKLLIANGSKTGRALGGQ